METTLKTKEEHDIAQEIFCSYFDNAPNIVFIIGADKRIITFNKLAAKHIYLDHNIRIKAGDSAYDYVDKTLRASFDKHFEQSIQGKRIKEDIQVFSPDNDKWWSVEYAPITNGEEDVVAVSMTICNVTEARKVKRQYEEISLVSQVGGWEIDFSNDTTEWSPITKQICEVPDDVVTDMYQGINFFKEGEDRDIIRRVLREAHETGKPFDVELQIVTYTGKVRWTRTKGQAEFYQGKIARLFGTFQDVTEKRNMYDELLVSQQYYKSLFEQNPDAVFALDLNERFLSINENTATLAESTVAEMINQSFARFCPPEDMEKVMHAFNEAQRGNSISYDCGFITANGNWKDVNITNLPVVINGVVVAVYGIAKDISESIAAKNQLLKSEANLRAVFDNTDIGYVLLTDYYKIVSFNKHADRYITDNYSKKLEENGNLLDIHNVEDRKMLFNVSCKVLAGEKVEYERNIHIKEDDEWYNIIYHPVYGDSERVIGIIMEIENITDRKKSEIELEKSFNLLNEQNKRLLNFSYIISHNLRSHTSNIKSILTFLEEAETEEEKKEMMEYLNHVSSSLDETIHNLNDVVSINNSVNLIYRPLFLIEFISKATDILKEQIIQKKVIIENKLLIDTSVDFNPAFLESIMLNFLSNAIKYSHPDRQPIITLDSYIDGGQFVLTIADNGIGIDMEKNGDKLFGFYKTFNGNSDARGLGLFICKNQVEYMGGKIEVDSVLGKGTTFKIFFK